jgi:hypothetical protein
VFGSVGIVFLVVLRRHSIVGWHRPSNHAVRREIRCLRLCDQINNSVKRFLLNFRGPFNCVATRKSKFFLSVFEKPPYEARTVRWPDITMHPLYNLARVAR